MAEPWLVRDMGVAVQVDGGSYYHLDNGIADWNLTKEANLVTYDAIGDTFATVVETGHIADLELLGLYLGAGDEGADLVEDVGENERHTATFWFCHPKHDRCGPVGQIQITRPGLVNNDGVLAIDTTAQGARGSAPLETWQYGRMLPADFAQNMEVNPATEYERPVAGQWVVIEVIDDDNCTELMVEYRISDSEKWQYEVPSGTLIDEGLHIGQLVHISSGESLPASQLSSGTWRLNVTPANTTAQVRIGILGKDW